MKINKQILSIPPHISTSWKNIASLHMVEEVLVVTLTNGNVIEIPHLKPDTVKKVFETHTDSLETESSAVNLGFPMKLGIEGLEGMGSVMMHNPSQANMPNLPTEILEKVTHLSKSLGIEESAENFPKAEPHCNCMYCQIARAIHNGCQNKEGRIEEVKDEEEEVTDEDLKFRDDWNIEQVSEKLYMVSHSLNVDEQYQVYLGNPIGCTCGQKKCEHVRAVLNS